MLTGNLNSERVLLLLGCLLFTIVLIRNAWLSDDAYITFRTIDNFTQGYGLTWNPSERVQTYTHPLWLIFVLPLCIVTNEIFYTVLFLSITVSIIAISLLVFKIAQTTQVAVFCLMILVFSKAFIDYSTSGLENALSHLLIMTALAIYLRQKLNFKTWFCLSILAGLATLNRMDLLLIYIPLLSYGFIKQPTWKSLGILTTGFLPVFGWLLFSTFYYGTPFPNTAYAKLNTGIERTILIEQGVHYLLNAINLDPITPFFIITGLIFPLVVRHKRLFPISISIVLYVIYLVFIGGDFMSGRFLTVPLLMAVVIIADSLVLTSVIPSLCIFMIIGLIGLNSEYMPLYSNAEYGPDYSSVSMLDNKGIADERRFYYQNAGLLRVNRYEEIPNHVNIERGKLANINNVPLIVTGGIGYIGYYAGPTVHVLDCNALSDPLLARLPVVHPEWRIGHFGRGLPTGYIETLLSRQNKLINPSLANYYDKLSFITRGPLWSFDRLVEIWYFNTSEYDYLLTEYATILHLNNSKPVFNWGGGDQLEQYTGMQFNLGREVTYKYLSITLRTGLHHASTIEYPDVPDYCLSPQQPSPDNRHYLVYYLYRGIQVGKQEMTLPITITEDNLIIRHAIPTNAVWHGYDSLKIFPLNRYHFDSVIYNVFEMELVN